MENSLHMPESELKAEILQGLSQSRNISGKRNLSEEKLLTGNIDWFLLSLMLHYWLSSYTIAVCVVIWRAVGQSAIFVLIPSATFSLFLRN